MRVAHRFVDGASLPTTKVRFDAAGPTVTGQHGPPSIPDQKPTVSIGNDSRFVLAAPQYEWIASQPALVVPADGVVDLRPLLPPVLAGAAKVLLLPSLRLDNVWAELKSSVVETVEHDGAHWVPIRLVVPDEFRGKTVLFNVSAFGLRWGRETRIEFPVTRIPAGAVMEASIGLRNPQQASSPADFTMSACDTHGCEELTTRKLDPTEAGRDVPWQDIRVDLSAYEGREMAFIFSTKLNSEDSLPGLFPLWGHPTLYTAESPPADAAATNLILISLDTLSARHLDIYGYPLATAPKMRERFSKRGVIFDHCVAAATATAPSHMTMLTGVHPLEHGLTDGMAAVQRSATSVTEILRANGLTTAAFTEDGWMSVVHGFGRGFDRFSEDRSPDMMAPVGRVESTFGQARDWLHRNREKAFFLFLHTFEVHDPYAPPLGYRQLFHTENPSAAEGTVDRIENERLAYDQEIRYLDDQLALLLDEVDRLGLSDKTLVVLTSDHGEAFGKHGYLRHGNYIHESVTHVPLMMQGPGVRPARRIAELVGHVDIMPTALEVLGVANPRPIQRGVSFKRQLDGGAPAGYARDRTMFSESWGTFVLNNNYELTAFLPPAIAARRGDRKVVRYRTEAGYKYEAYDLGADPGEARDLAIENPDGFRDLRLLLDEYEPNAAEGRSRMAADAPSGSSTEGVRLDPDQEEKLRALGYLQ